MDYREQLQPGVGFLHLQRTLQPGERIPALPSLLAQLSALQSAMGNSIPPADPDPEPEAAEVEAEELED
jgi:hypothetical protein